MIENWASRFNARATGYAEMRSSKSAHVPSRLPAPWDRSSFTFFILLWLPPMLVTFMWSPLAHLSSLQNGWTSFPPRPRRESFSWLRNGSKFNGTRLLFRPGPTSSVRLRIAPSESRGRRDPHLHRFRSAPWKAAGCCACSLAAEDADGFLMFVKC